MPSFMSSQDAVDSIVSSKKREREYLYSNFYHQYLAPSFTSSLSTTSDSSNVSQPMMTISDIRNNSRMKICSWAFNIVDYFDFNRQTAVISMDIFDRFMATRGNRCTPDFALLSAITALFISIKINETRKIKSDALAKFSRNQFSSSDIEEMESEILQDLTWLVHPPTASYFLFPLISFLPQGVNDSARKVVFEKAQYLTELSVFDPFFMDQHSSTIAFAALMITLENEMRSDSIPSFSLNHFYANVNEYIQLPEYLSFDKVKEKLTILILDQMKIEEEEDIIHSRKRSRRSDTTSPKSTAVFEFDRSLSW